jgi:flagellar M-ring protein FliF
VIDAQSRDGLAGDIELALRGIDNVEDARVIVAPAKGGLFADQTSQDATASVRLRVTPGARLPADAIGGIRAFVAAAVPGLDTRNVTILDDRGIALTEGGDPADEADLQRSLQSALDSTIGPGSSLVRLHVEYDTRSVTSHQVRRAPAAPDAISVERQDERYTTTGKKYSKSSTTLERGTDEREITAATRPGRITRITAAVFVDAGTVTNLGEVKSLAAATLGIDTRRGDTLQVEPVPFKHTATARRDVWLLAYGVMVPALPAVVTAIAVLLALRCAVPVLAPFVRRLSERALTARTVHAVQGIPPGKVRGVLADEPAHTAAAIISALPAATAAAVLDMYPEHERSAIVRRMQRPVSPLLYDPEELIIRA